MKTIAIVGAFDTKYTEFEYLKEKIEKNGLKTLMIHSGIFPSKLKVDIDNTEIVSLLGEDINNLRKEKTRGHAVTVMSKSLEVLISNLYKEGAFDGIIGMGGTGGTSTVSPSFRNLPIGFPKVLVSTVAGKDVSYYVGGSDLIMYPSITDISGLNTISKKIIKNAANMISGMVNYDTEKEVDKKFIGATMFGLTGPGVEGARDILQKEGYEVVIFHASGTGGAVMEKLIYDGQVEAVLDITPTEIVDELFGGIFSAGEHRLEAAIDKEIPQVISLGALDMINFGPMNTLPENMKNRNAHYHNATTTVVRTTVSENEIIAKTMAKKLNKAKSKIYIVVPLRGFSELDNKDNVFFDKEANEKLISTLKSEIDNENIEFVEVDCHINDSAFSKIISDLILKLLKEKEV